VDIAILDGYTDEPAALGVPPYMAPLPRYLAGAAWSAGVEGVLYTTIDDVRSQSRPEEPRSRGYRRGRDTKDARGRLQLPDADQFALLVLIGGAVVPGKYLRGRPASPRELVELANNFPGPTLLVGSAARWGWVAGSTLTQMHYEAFSHVASRDGDAYLKDLLDGDEEPRQRFRTDDEWARWSEDGAEILDGHPDIPHPMVAEVETYRGCVRHAWGGCSFCTTVRDMAPLFREPSEIAAEVRSLARHGVVSFRLGGQSCIYSYKALGVGEVEVPVPDPHAIRSLLEGIHRAAPHLEVLHVDNANPAVIAENPSEAKRVTQLLVEHCTGGNVVAFGLETADPAVKRLNNLNATPDQCLAAIRMVHGWGGYTSGNGMPALLPGINFLAGLPGETPETFDLNLAFLKRVLSEGLLLRRINIRQVAPVNEALKIVNHPREFRRFKLKVRQDVDLPILERMFPFGAPLKKVWTEVHDGNTTFGRQIGSYPLLVGISAKLELNAFIDVRVVGYGMRSVSAIPDPLDINGCPLSLLESIPGIGRKRAARIARGRPYSKAEDLKEVLDDPAVAKSLLSLLSLD
jgi:radical SAM superfamily enzyme with C-terminal helix-hairpin-helix motif